MNLRRWTFTLGLVALVAAVAAAGWWRFGRTVVVDTVTVQIGAVPVPVRGPGSVQARVPITVASRLTATVTAMHADVGDSVRAGQLLATLDDRDLQARLSVVASQRETQQRSLEAAQATLRKAQADLALALSRQQRDAALGAQGFLSAAGLEASAASQQSALAAVQGAEATLAARRAEQATQQHELAAAATTASYTRLLAPMDALVVQRLAEPGSTVVPGSPLLKLVDPASVWVAMRVDEAQVARIQPGQAARITLRSGSVHAGRVVRIARQTDAATREIDVFVAFDTVPAGFAIDQEAVVTVDTGMVTGLRLPITALMAHPDGRRGVLRVVDGRTRFAAVRTGAGDGDAVLVLQGLAAGDVVAAPAAGLREGQRVTPAR